MANITFLGEQGAWRGGGGQKSRQDRRSGGNWSSHRSCFLEGRVEVGLYPEGEVPAWADRARGGGRRASFPRSDFWNSWTQF